MITFYLNGGPNPLKVSLLLEELGLAYRPAPVDVFSGEQFGSELLAHNPNAKVPVIVEPDGTTVFDSNAILLYLGEKHGRFIPAEAGKPRAELLSWLMFVATGVGPFSGQAVHFRHAAPETLPYAIGRYDYEARRHFEILDARLATREFLVAESYTIVDMALWGWASFLPRIVGEEAAGGYRHVRRLIDWIDARPAARRARALPVGDAGPSSRIKGNLHLFRHLDARKTGPARTSPPAGGDPA